MRVFLFRRIHYVITILVIIGLCCFLIFLYASDGKRLAASVFGRFKNETVEREWINYHGYIPRRLHQIYKDEMIPATYGGFMLTWVKNEPDWEYYFWTDHDALTMINERYPEYRQLIQSYDHRLMKSDAIRYLILHQYGGVYADLDMESLRPLEPLLQSHSCILTPEPLVQTRLLFSLPWTLTNCIMACAANHPFLTYLLKELEKAKRPYTTNTDVLYSTGPFFLNQSHTAYINQFPQCTETGVYCTVNVTNQKNLVPVPDVDRLREGRRDCLSPSLTARYTELQLDACKRLETLTAQSTPPDDSYTNHKWTHLGWFPERKQRKVNISNINPGVIRYKVKKSG